jgi:peptidyl-prolyl cis-trans isomerase SurA
MGHRSRRRAGGAERRWCASIAALAIALLQGAAYGQQAAGGAAATPLPGPPPAVAAQTPADRVALDQVVAIVNGDLVLESDVDAEQWMVAFQPLRDTAPVTRDQLIDRLIDRDLILQQADLQPGPPITDAEVDEELGVLRKAIPECAAYHCETDAGWEKFVADHGFTLDELRERWRERMEVLRFIEQRFRMGIRISQAEIDDYYQKTLLPAYEKQKAAAPAEATIADNIQEILLQQQVNKLLDDWLTSLRAQGSVRMVKPGEELP